MKNVFSSAAGAARYLLGLALLLADFGAAAQAPGWDQVTIPTMTSTGSASVVASVADASGNLYLLGHCAGTVSFGSTTFTFSASGADTYVAKWNPTNGFMWAVRGGGGTGASDADNAYITPTSLAIQGNSLYMAGTFDGPTAAFGSTVLQNGGAFLTTRNGFVAKLTDAGTSASFVWAQRLSFAPLQSGFSLAALGVSGSSLYVTGYFLGGTFSVGNVPLTNAGIADIYVAKLTDAGSSASVVWAQRAGGTSNDQATALLVSGSSVYLTGFTNSGPATFGSVSVPSIGSFVKNVFVAKLTDAGATGSFVWATRAGSTGLSDVSGAKLALSGSRLYVAGLYSGDAVFGSSNLPTIGFGTDYNVFVASLTDAGTSGAFVWGQGAGSSGLDYLDGLATNGTGIYITGHFTGPTATFGSTALTNPNAATSPSAIYLARLTDAGSNASFAWAQQAGATTTAATANRSLAASVLLAPGRGYVLGDLAGSFTGATPPSSTTGTFGSISFTTPGSFIPFIATFLDNGLLATAPAAAHPALPLWPNPAHGTATVRLPPAAAPQPLILTDALGRELRRYPASPTAETMLDLHGLPAGLYLLHAGSSAQRLTVE